VITTNDLDTLLSRGGNVLGQGGTKIGKIGQIYLNDATGEPEWVTAHTGLFSGGESFIPLEHATASGNDLTVPYSKDQVKDAPHSNDSDGSLEVDQEADLYRHYGMADPYAGPADTQQVYDQDAERSGRDESGDVGHDTSGANTDDAMTRSEERLHVGTRQQEAGRARLRKYIVTEQQTQNVAVSHDEVHVTREPITEANMGDALSGGDLTEEEHEVTLMADQVVTDKETVPVERIRLDTETITDQQEVTADVRKEQIEFDGDDGTATGRHGDAGAAGDR
jgi:uncharacterized protein (TIGR02271 family)